MKRATNTVALYDGVLQPIKQCRKCDEWKPLTHFSKESRYKDGRCPYCKVCKSGNTSKWYAEHKEHVSEYRNERRNHINAYHRAWRAQDYQRNQAKYLEQQRSKKWRNPVAWQRYLASCRAYKKRNPDKMNEWKHRRRARLNASNGVYTVAEWRALCQFFGNICLACTSSDQLTVDHVIPISKGGHNTIESLQPLCFSCNASKHDKHIDYRDPTQLATFLRMLPVLSHS